ncbi:MAG: hypothetical protein HY303_08280 [Candidatus Wallbacteria bacterium]|nr:hypothetical protein [Candidatus Wallbacteria bacterium]
MSDPANPIYLWPGGRAPKYRRYKRERPTTDGPCHYCGFHCELYVACDEHEQVVCVLCWDTGSGICCMGNTLKLDLVTACAEAVGIGHVKNGRILAVRRGAVTMEPIN